MLEEFGVDIPPLGVIPDCGQNAGWFIVPVCHTLDLYGRISFANRSVSLYFDFVITSLTYTVDRASRSPRRHSKNQENILS